MVPGPVAICTLFLAFAASPAGAVDMPSLKDIAAAHGVPHDGGAYAARLELTEIWVRRSPTPGPPWHTSRGLRCDRLDAANRRHAGYLRHRGAGFRPLHRAHRLGSGDGWRADLFNGWLLPAGPGRFDAEARRTRRLAPVLLIDELARNPEAVSGPEPAGDNRFALRYLPEHAPAMRLTFDTRTRLLRRLEQDSLAVAFDEYEIVQGLPVSRRMRVSRDGETVYRVRASTVRFQAPFPAGLSPPVESSEAKGTEAPGADMIRVRELADGAYLVGAGERFQLFVAFRDFLVALGGVGGVPRRLSAVRELAGDLPLRYALITHHHAEHLEGVPALVDGGAVIVASAAHERAIREAAGERREPRFAFVADRSEISDGGQRLVFLELGPMRHARHMLGALLPDQGLLFTADVFRWPPERDAGAATPPIEDLAAVVERLDLDVTRFAGTQGPIVPNLAHLRLALSREGRMDDFGDYESAICP